MGQSRRRRGRESHWFLHLSPPLLKECERNIRQTINKFKGGIEKHGPADTVMSLGVDLPLGLGSRTKQNKTKKRQPVIIINIKQALSFHKQTGKTHHQQLSNFLLGETWLQFSKYFGEEIRIFVLADTPIVVGVRTNPPLHMSSRYGWQCLQKQSEAWNNNKKRAHFGQCPRHWDTTQAGVGNQKEKRQSHECEEQKPQCENKQQGLDDSQKRKEL